MNDLLGSALRIISGVVFLGTVYNKILVRSDSVKLFMALVELQAVISLSIKYLGWTQSAQSQ